MMTEDVHTISTNGGLIMRGVLQYKDSLKLADAMGSSWCLLGKLNS